MALALLAVGSIGAWLNAWVEPQLQVIARQQTGIALNNIVQKVIATMDYDAADLVSMQRGTDGEILTLDYDTMALNQILADALEKIEGQNYGDAKDLLIAAQQKAEDIYITAED